MGALQIVILDGFTLNPGDLSYDALTEFGRLSVYDRTPEEETARRLLGADIVFTNKTPLREEHFVRANRLKYIGVLATGYDVVDTAAARARGIAVCNVPDYGTDAVAEHVFALILEIARGAGRHDRAVHQGRWTHSPDYCFWETPLFALSGKTLGVLGCGRIGRRVSEIGGAFGMRVLGCSPHERAGFAGEYVDFPALLAESDILTLHCPATDATRGIMNRDTFRRMKDGAILINTARGALVDEQDLFEALESRKLFAAGVDVVSREPVSAANPLLKAPNCIITPHNAWATYGARKRLIEISVENLRSFLGGNPANLVN